MCSLKFFVWSHLSLQANGSLILNSIYVDKIYVLLFAQRLWSIHFQQTITLSYKGLSINPWLMIIYKDHWKKHFNIYSISLLSSIFSFFFRLWHTLYFALQDEHKVVDYFLLFHVIVEHACDIKHTRRWWIAPFKNLQIEV